MRLEILDLGPRLRLLPCAENSSAYRTLTARLYAEIWRAYPHVWKMHGVNGQFQTIEINGEPRNAIPATKHCVAQAARAQVLAEMLGIPRQLIKKLVAGVLLTDSYKFKEWLYMQEVGPSWDSYAEAQRRAHTIWHGSTYLNGDEIDFAMSVAHETLLTMELICADAEEGVLDEHAICKLIAHYVDDISRDHDWVTEKTGYGFNVLDARMLRNTSNPTYARLNEEGRVRLPQEATEAGFPGLFTLGEMTYQAQGRVGHTVEALLAERLRMRIEVARGEGGEPVDIDPLNLPVIIDNEIRRRFALAYRDLRRGGVNALRARPILSRR